jgi:hypothetical protein
LPAVTTDQGTSRGGGEGGEADTSVPEFALLRVMLSIRKKADRCPNAVFRGYTESFEI